MKKIYLLIFIIAVSSNLNAQTYPFSENFNSMPSFSSPTGWTTGIAGFQVYDTHGTSASKGMCKQLTSFSLKDSVTSPVIGPLTANDAITFDYRIVQTSLYPSSPITMAANDKIELKIVSGGNSILIGQIDATNHITSTSFASKSYNLSAFAGQNIQVRIVSSKASTSYDYFTDFDNIVVNTATGINTIAGNNEVTIAYNQQFDRPVIHLNNLPSTEYNARIINISGSTLFEQLLKEGDDQVVTPPFSLAKGYYILNISGKKNAYNFKFLVQ